MRKIKLYCPLEKRPPLAEFLETLEDKLAEKTIRQIFRLADTPLSQMKEPHIKHFTIERYSRFYELRERGKICVRLVFTFYDGDVLLLAPFLKREKRDTMQALELSLRMMEAVQADPALAVCIQDRKEDFI